MSRGRHAAPKKHNPPAAAARTALVRTSAFTVGLGLTWTLVTAVADQDYLEAFAAGTHAEVQPPADTALTEKQVRRINNLNEAYDCSSEGLDPGVTPARAVVRVAGQVRLATFDEGWAMHLGHARGTLVSVCAR